MNKQTRINPRKKYWMIGKRDKDGRIFCFADCGLMEWKNTYGRLWDHAISPIIYLKRLKADKNEDVFIIRINSKKCPIEIDFLNKAPFKPNCNVLFKVK